MFVLTRACSLFVLCVFGVSSSAVLAQDGTLTSGFGVRRDPFTGGARNHAGADLGAHEGHPVYATGDGVVLRSRRAGGYGNLVEMAHGYGYVTRFGHLSRLLVGEGQYIRRGQLIGLVGSTGRSTGPHLHYEVRINGKAVNPARFMQIVFAQPVSPAQLMAQVQRPAPPVGSALALAAPVSAGRRATGTISIDNYFGVGGPQEPQGSSDGFAAGHVKGSND